MTYSTLQQPQTENRYAAGYSLQGLRAGEYRRLIGPWASYVQDGLQRYERWCQDYGRRQVPQIPKEEAAVEWLALACRLQSYGYWCSRWSGPARRALLWGSQLRRHHRNLGNGALALVYGTLIPPPEHRSPTGTWNLATLEKMVAIMTSSPDFSEEAPVYRAWLDYLSALSEDLCQTVFRQLRDTARWFQQQADDVLGSLTDSTPTPSVQNDNKPSVSKKRVPPSFVSWQDKLREDRILRSMAALDYQLALTVAELLNLAYRDEYCQTSVREMLVPTCLCSCRCQRETTAAGVRCQQCQVDCEVGQLTALGKEFGCGVLILSHATGTFPAALQRPENRGQVGIIGIACAAHLLPGGWRCRRHGLAAQCVPLHGSGCSHWLEQPQQTSLDLSEVSRILALTTPVTPSEISHPLLSEPAGKPQQPQKDISEAVGHVSTTNNGG